MTYDEQEMEIGCWNSVATKFQTLQDAVRNGFDATSLMWMCRHIRVVMELEMMRLEKLEVEDD